MAIRTLPQATVRAIGASQVLNDPAAAVKELLDNALDARASAISVEISSNTLDSIQVRDNGHGIPPEDRKLVARPHCTSKIANEDHLNSVGGGSLGFRGEALASVAELSGSLTITTRVEGEQLATALIVDQRGEVVGQQRASLPLGTTVKITDFIKANPVRRQVVLKTTEKGLSRIKHCLQSYAFARPHVRLSLRVLKSKNERANWTYAPKPGGNAEDAAFKIVGAACASQCICSVVEDHGFTLKAFLPKPDAEVGNISNIGAFLSVDARPLSVGRGTSKQIVKIYRDALKQADPKFDGVREPFLYLEISCPSASYDANIDPAKDDVLFADPDIVIETARRLFAAVYPPTGIEHPEAPPDRLPEQSPSFEDDHMLLEDDFLTSLEPRPENHESGVKSKQQAPLQLVTDDMVRDLKRENGCAASEVFAEQQRPSFRHNMYGCDEDDLELFGARPPTGQTEAEFEELRHAQYDVNVSNPWVIAKMNTPLRPRFGGQEQAGAAAAEFRSTMDDAPGLPTPRPSSPFASPSKSAQPDIYLNSDTRTIGRALLPPPHMSIAPPRRSDDDSDYAAEDQHCLQQPSLDFLPSSQSFQMPSGTPLRSIPEVGSVSSRPPRKRVQQQARLNKPFVSLVDQQPRERVWFDHLEELDQGKHRPTQKRHQLYNGNGLVRQGELGDLVDDPEPLMPPRRNRDMRDFVRPVNRSAEGVEQGSLVHAREGSLINEATRVSKRRKTSEARVLREVSGNAAVVANEDREFHPTVRRARSSRRRKTTEDAKVSRRKSSLISLERVPQGQGTHNIILIVSTTVSQLSALAEIIDEESGLVAMGAMAQDAIENCPQASGVEEMREVTAKLYELLVSRVSDEEMVQDLGLLLQDAFAAHAKAFSEA